MTIFTKKKKTEDNILGSSTLNSFFVHFLNDMDHVFLKLRDAGTYDSPLTPLIHNIPLNRVLFKRIFLPTKKVHIMLNFNFCDYNISQEHIRIEQHIRFNLRETIFLIQYLSIY